MCRSLPSRQAPSKHVCSRHPEQSCSVTSVCSGVAMTSMALDAGFVELCLLSSRVQTCQMLQSQPKAPNLQSPIQKPEPFPKGPCTQIVYTLALKYSLYRYIGAKVYTIWVHGPLRLMLQSQPNSADPQRDIPNRNPKKPNQPKSS